MSAPIHALAVAQPWAHLAAAGTMPALNHTHGAPERALGGYLAICASREVDEDAGHLVASCGAVLPPRESLARDAVLAVGRLERVTEVGPYSPPQPSPLIRGPLVWWLAEVVALPAPVSCRAHGPKSFALAADVLAQVREGYGEARAAARAAALHREMDGGWARALEADAATAARAQPAPTPEKPRLIRCQACGGRRWSTPGVHSRAHATGAPACPHGRPALRDCAGVLFWECPLCPPSALALESARAGQWGGYAA